MTDERWTPAEAVAASVCWLARWQAGSVPGVIVRGVTFWHSRRCRFCSRTMEELLLIGDLTRVEPDALNAFQRLPAKARAARVYEAQEDPWWEKM